NILTRTDGSVIENIDYFTDEERKTATGRLGILQGDITLNQLRNSLQRIMMDPYDTGNVENTAGAAGPSLSLLAQIGISTNSVQPGTGVSIDAAKLRGYLEINETALDENISSRLQSIRNLFGRDRDGDLVVDSGVAWAVDAYARPYTQSGGILATRLRNLDTQISRNSSDIETLNMQLSRKEQDLKSKYGQLEGTLSGLDQSSKAIENFSGSLNGNR
ncbi:MAG: flagellar hook-associated protein, partial [Spirochaetales bacterium]